MDRSVGKGEGKGDDVEVLEEREDGRESGAGDLLGERGIGFAKGVPKSKGLGAALTGDGGDGGSGVAVPERVARAD